MSELQDAADHLVIIGRGRLIASTSVTDLVSAASADMVLLRTPRQAEVRAALARSGVTVAAVGADTLTGAGPSADRLAARLSAHGLPFFELAQHRATLEEAYLELTRGAVEFRVPTLREA